MGMLEFGVYFISDHSITHACETSRWNWMVYKYWAWQSPRPQTKKYAKVDSVVWKTHKKPGKYSYPFLSAGVVDWQKLLNAACESMSF